MERKSRAEDARELVGDEPDHLWIHPRVLERYKEKGLTLRWLRFTEGDEKMDRRLQMRRQQGWEFVRPDEVPEWDTPPSMEHGRLGGLIAVGDVALAAIPTEISKRLKAASEKRARDMADAVRNNLLQHNNSMMPITDTSKQVSTTGSRSTKFGE